MKFVFIVQGEGRGHMTQAISLHDLLIQQGHEVSAVILGSGGGRTKPEFFYRKIKAPVIQVKSPNFVTDAENKSIKIMASVLHTIRYFNTFRESFRMIERIIEEHQPDIVVNFYELLAGLYFKFKKPTCKMVGIAHQYTYLHGGFEFPKGFRGDRMALKAFTKLTAGGSSKLLAISLYDLPGAYGNVKIVPPLLRDELFALKPDTKDFVLVYLVNNGYAHDVANWHAQHQDVVLHCYTDKLKIQNLTYTHPNFNLHQVDDKAFLECMSQARGLATTAGFESVCEAMYLGKPVYMVPVEGHFEQFCNSRDASKAGAGTYGTSFDIDTLLKISAPGFHTNGRHTHFRHWVDSAKPMIYEELLTTLSDNDK